jgi:uncharacterized protein
VTSATGTASESSPGVLDDSMVRSVIGSWTAPRIDTDVHAVVPNVRSVFPYLAPVWQEFIDEREWKDTPAVHYTYPPGLASSAREEWKPGPGLLPGADLALLQKHILDPANVKYAILNCTYPVDEGHPDLAAALAAAVNDWLIAEWLDLDPRLRASIVVPSLRDPVAVTKEIERVASHPGFVQVQMPVKSGRGYGERVFHPVLEAISNNDLVMGIHWGGFNAQLPPTASGWPSWYAEEYAGARNIYIAQLASLVAQGAFQAFPKLRVSFQEIGFLWLPSQMWMFDKDWKGLRREVPWLDRLPSEIIREHVRFSSSPLDAGSKLELERTIGWLGSEEIVMYSSDYPHYHDDDLDQLLSAVPEPMRQKLMFDNASEWYRL